MTMTTNATGADIWMTSTRDGLARNTNKEGENMVKCYECGREFDDDDRQHECPFCGEEDMGEGFYFCENCETLMNYSGDMWECEYCENEGKKERHSHNHRSVSFCPECGAELDDDYCDECGWPDVNQGWLGEEYG